MSSSTAPPISASTPDVSALCRLCPTLIGRRRFECMQLTAILLMLCSHSRLSAALDRACRPARHPVRDLHWLQSGRGRFDVESRPVTIDHGRRCVGRNRFAPIHRSSPRTRRKGEARTKPRTNLESLTPNKPRCFMLRRDHRGGILFGLSHSAGE